jgi:hypothetical protein
MHFNFRNDGQEEIGKDTPSVCNLRLSKVHTRSEKVMETSSVVLKNRSATDRLYPAGIFEKVDKPDQEGYRRTQPSGGVISKECKIRYNKLHNHSRAVSLFFLEFHKHLQPCGFIPFYFRER